MVQPADLWNGDDSSVPAAAGSVASADSLYIPFKPPMRFGKIRDEKHRDDEPVLFSRDQLRMKLSRNQPIPGIICAE